MNIRIACTAIAKRIMAGRISKNGKDFVGEPKLTIHDGIWWPEGYCRDPNGAIIAPVGMDAHFNFGRDIGYAEGLVAHKESVAAIELRVRANSGAG
jgi:hypothetical protein